MSVDGFDELKKLPKGKGGSEIIKEKDGKICLFEFINIGALR